MHNELILAGFGGQGIVSAGRLIACACMMDGKNVSALPSYGPEMRGGTANCQVIISDEEIGSPLAINPNVLIAMSIPSLDKFENSVYTNGIIILDSSLIKKIPKRNDLEVYKIPSTELALEMGNLAFANIILLGKYISSTKIVSKDNFIKALHMVLPKKKHYLIPDEVKALEMGMEY